MAKDKSGRTKQIAFRFEEREIEWIDRQRAERGGITRAALVRLALASLAGPLPGTRARRAKKIPDSGSQSD